MKEAFVSCPNFLYGWVYPMLLSVILMAFTYAVISPIVSVFALMYFLLAELVYKNQALYVYVAQAESGGIMFPGVIQRLLFGVYFSHVLLMGYFIVASAWFCVVLMIILQCTDILFYNYVYYAYERPSQAVPLRTAAENDRIEKEEGSPGLKTFNRMLYEQPEMHLEPIGPEPYTGGSSAAGNLSLIVSSTEGYLNRDLRLRRSPGSLDS